MTSGNNPKKEQPSTYFVQDRSNVDELTRVTLQDQMFTAGMGGVLPEQPDPTVFQRVLDVGCGAGRWLIEAARMYPTMSLLIGVDVSSKMVEYAREQAKAEGVADRVEFRVMDVLRLLEFPDNYFDLVNQRMGMSYLRTWDWPKVLTEYQRVCSPGGVIRITESDLSPDNNSPSLTRLIEIFIEAFYNSGHLSKKDGRAVIDGLAPLFKFHGLKEIQTREYYLAPKPGSPESHALTTDIKLAYKTILPFLRKYAAVPDNYDEIYQNMLKEIQAPDFQAPWHLLTAWGVN